MKTRKSHIFFILLLSAFYISCEDDETIAVPIESGANVEVRNTLQITADPGQGGTGGEELPIEIVLGVDSGTYELSTSVSEAIEFDDYLEGLYNIDLMENSIEFSLVADTDHPIYSSFFRTIEAGTFDRYYFSFPNGHSISSSTSNKDSVVLNIISSTEIVVVIGEGWSFNPNSTFTITLN